MSDFDSFQKRADELLRKATATHDLTERSRLITEAAHWHMKATEAFGQASPPSADHTVVPFGDEASQPEAAEPEAPEAEA